MISHLLMVEDDDDHAELIEYQLNRSACAARISRCTDGEEALAFLGPREGDAAQRPDLVLLDLNLPKRSGLEVLAAMKQDAELRRIPVIMMTTSTSARDLKQAYDLHCNAYVTKPMDFSEFSTMIGSLSAFWCQWNQAAEDTDKEGAS